MTFYRGYTIEAIRPGLYEVYVTRYHGIVYTASSVKDAMAIVDYAILGK